MSTKERDERKKRKNWNYFLQWISFTLKAFWMVIFTEKKIKFLHYLRIENIRCTCKKSKSLFFMVFVGRKERRKSWSIFSVWIKGQVNQDMGYKCWCMSLNFGKVPFKKNYSKTGLWLELLQPESLHIKYNLPSIIGF